MQQHVGWHLGGIIIASSFDPFEPIIWTVKQIESDCQPKEVCAWRLSNWIPGIPCERTEHFLGTGEGKINGFITGTLLPGSLRSYTYLVVGSYLKSTKCCFRFISKNKLKNQRLRHSWKSKTYLPMMMTMTRLTSESPNDVMSAALHSATTQFLPHEVVPQPNLVTAYLVGNS